MPLRLRGDFKFLLIVLVPIVLLVAVFIYIPAADTASRRVICVR